MPQETRLQKFQTLLRIYQQLSAPARQAVQNLKDLYQVQNYSHADARIQQAVIQIFERLAAGFTQNADDLETDFLAQGKQHDYTAGNVIDLQNSKEVSELESADSSDEEESAEERGIFWHYVAPVAINKKEFLEFKEFNKVIEIVELYFAEKIEPLEVKRRQDLIDELKELTAVPTDLLYDNPVDKDQQIVNDFITTFLIPEKLHANLTIFDNDIISLFSENAEALVRNRIVEDQKRLSAFYNLINLLTDEISPVILKLLDGKEDPHNLKDLIEQARLIGKQHYPDSFTTANTIDKIKNFDVRIDAIADLVEPYFRVKTILDLQTLANKIEFPEIYAQLLSIKVADSLQKGLMQLVLQSPPNKDVEALNKLLSAPSFGGEDIEKFRQAATLVSTILKIAQRLSRLKTLFIQLDPIREKTAGVDLRDLVITDGGLQAALTTAPINLNFENSAEKAVLVLITLPTLDEFTHSFFSKIDGPKDISDADFEELYEKLKQAVPLILDTHTRLSRLYALRNQVHAESFGRITFLEMMAPDGNKNRQVQAIRRFVETPVDKVDSKLPSQLYREFVGIDDFNIFMNKWSYSCEAYQRIGWVNFLFTQFDALNMEPDIAKQAILHLVATGGIIQLSLRRPDIAEQEILHLVATDDEVLRLFMALFPVEDTNAEQAITPPWLFNPDNCSKVLPPNGSWNNFDLAAAQNTGIYKIAVQKKLFTTIRIAKVNQLSDKAACLTDAAIARIAASHRTPEQRDLWQLVDQRSHVRNTLLLDDLDHIQSTVFNRQFPMRYMQALQTALDNELTNELLYRWQVIAPIVKELFMVSGKNIRQSMLASIRGNYAAEEDLLHLLNIAVAYCNKIDADTFDINSPDCREVLLYSVQPKIGDRRLRPRPIFHGVFKKATNQVASLAASIKAAEKLRCKDHVSLFLKAWKEMPKIEAEHLQATGLNAELASLLVKKSLPENWEQTLYELSLSADNKIAGQFNADLKTAYRIAVVWSLRNQMTPAEKEELKQFVPLYPDSVNALSKLVVQDNDQDLAVAVNVPALADFDFSEMDKERLNTLKDIFQTLNNLNPTETRDLVIKSIGLHQALTAEPIKLNLADKVNQAAWQLITASNEPSLDRLTASELSFEKLNDIAFISLFTKLDQSVELIKKTMERFEVLYALRKEIYAQAIGKNEFLTVITADARMAENHTDHLHFQASQQFITLPENKLAGTALPEALITLEQSEFDALINELKWLRESCRRVAFCNDILREFAPLDAAEKENRQVIRDSLGKDESALGLFNTLFPENNTDIAVLTPRVEWDFTITHFYKVLPLSVNNLTPNFTETQIAMHSQNIREASRKFDSTQDTTASYYQPEVKKPILALIRMQKINALVDDVVCLSPDALNRINARAYRHSPEQKRLWDLVYRQSQQNIKHLRHDDTVDSKKVLWTDQQFSSDNVRALQQVINQELIKEAKYRFNIIAPMIKELNLLDAEQQREALAGIKNVFVGNDGVLQLLAIVKNCFDKIGSAGFDVNNPDHRAAVLYLSVEGARPVPVRREIFKKAGNIENYENYRNEIIESFRRTHAILKKNPKLVQNLLFIPISNSNQIFLLACLESNRGEQRLKDFNENVLVQNIQREMLKITNPSDEKPGINEAKKAFRQIAVAAESLHRTVEILRLHQLIATSIDSGAVHALLKNVDMAAFGNPKAFKDLVRFLELKDLNNANLSDLTKPPYGSPAEFNHLISVLESIILCSQVRQKIPKETTVHQVQTAGLNASLASLLIEETPENLVQSLSNFAVVDEIGQASNFSRCVTELQTAYRVATVWSLRHQITDNQKQILSNINIKNESVNKLKKLVIANDDQGLVAAVNQDLFRDNNFLDLEKAVRRVLEQINQVLSERKGRLVTLHTIFTGLYGSYDLAEREMTFPLVMQNQTSDQSTDIPANIRIAFASLAQVLKERDPADIQVIPELSMKAGMSGTVFLGEITDYDKYVHERAKRLIKLQFIASVLTDEVYQIAAQDPNFLSGNDNQELKHFVEYARTFGQLSQRVILLDDIDKISDFDARFEAVQKKIELYRRLKIALYLQELAGNINEKIENISSPLHALIKIALTKNRNVDTSFLNDLGHSIFNDVDSQEFNRIVATAARALKLQALFERLADIRKPTQYGIDIRELILNDHGLQEILAGEHINLNLRTPAVQTAWKVITAAASEILTDPSRITQGLERLNDKEFTALLEKLEVAIPSVLETDRRLKALHELHAQTHESSFGRDEFLSITSTTPQQTAIKEFLEVPAAKEGNGMQVRVLPPALNVKNLPDINDFTALIKDQSNLREGYQRIALANLVFDEAASLVAANPAFRQSMQAFLDGDQAALTLFNILFPALPPLEITKQWDFTLENCHKLQQGNDNLADYTHTIRQILTAIRIQTANSLINNIFCLSLEAVNEINAIIQMREPQQGIVWNLIYAQNNLNGNNLLDYETKTDQRKVMPDQVDEIPVYDQQFSAKNIDALQSTINKKLASEAKYRLIKIIKPLVKQFDEWGDNRNKILNELRTFLEGETKLLKLLDVVEAYHRELGTTFAVDDPQCLKAVLYLPNNIQADVDNGNSRVYPIPHDIFAAGNQLENLEALREEIMHSLGAIDTLLHQNQELIPDLKIFSDTAAHQGELHVSNAYNKLITVDKRLKNFRYNPLAAGIKNEVAQRIASSGQVPSIKLFKEGLAEIAKGIDNLWRYAQVLRLRKLVNSGANPARVRKLLQTLPSSFGVPPIAQLFGSTKAFDNLVETLLHLLDTQDLTYANFQDLTEFSYGNFDQFTNLINTFETTILYLQAWQKMPANVSSAKLQAAGIDVELAELLVEKSFAGLFEDLYKFIQDKPDEDYRRGSELNSSPHFTHCNETLRTSYRIAAVFSIRNLLNSDQKQLLNNTYIAAPGLKRLKELVLANNNGLTDAVNERVLANFNDVERQLWGIIKDIDLYVNQQRCVALNTLLAKIYNEDLGQDEFLRAITNDPRMRDAHFYALQQLITNFKFAAAELPEKLNISHFSTKDFNELIAELSSVREGYYRVAVANLILPEFSVLDVSVELPKNVAERNAVRKRIYDIFRAKENVPAMVLFDTLFPQNAEQAAERQWKFDEEHCSQVLSNYKAKDFDLATAPNSTSYTLAVRERVLIAIRIEKLNLSIQAAMSLRPEVMERIGAKINRGTSDQRALWQLISARSNLEANNILRYDDAIDESAVMPNDANQQLEYSERFSAKNIDVLLSTLENAVNDEAEDRLQKLLPLVRQLDAFGNRIIQNQVTGRLKEGIEGNAPLSLLLDVVEAYYRNLGADLFDAANDRCKTAVFYLQDDLLRHEIFREDNVQVLLELFQEQIQQQAAWEAEAKQRIGQVNEFLDLIQTWPEEAFVNLDRKFADEQNAENAVYINLYRYIIDEIRPKLKGEPKTLNPEESQHQTWVRKALDNREQASFDEMYPADRSIVGPLLNKMKTLEKERRIGPANFLIAQYPKVAVPVIQFEINFNILLKEEKPHKGSKAAIKRLAKVAAAYSSGNRELKDDNPDDIDIIMRKNLDKAFINKNYFITLRTIENAKRLTQLQLLNKRYRLFSNSSQNLFKQAVLNSKDKFENILLVHVIEYKHEYKILPEELKIEQIETEHFKVDTAIFDLQYKIIDARFKLTELFDEAYKIYWQLTDQYVENEFIPSKIKLDDVFRKLHNELKLIGLINPQDVNFADIFAGLRESNKELDNSRQRIENISNRLKYIKEAIESGCAGMQIPDHFGENLDEVTNNDLKKSIKAVVRSDVMREFAAILVMQYAPTEEKAQRQIVVKRTDGLIRMCDDGTEENIVPNGKQEIEISAAALTGFLIKDEMIATMAMTKYASQSPKITNDQPPKYHNPHTHFTGLLQDTQDMDDATLKATYPAEAAALIAMRNIPKHKDKLNPEEKHTLDLDDPITSINKFHENPGNISFIGIPSCAQILIYRSKAEFRDIKLRHALAGFKRNITAADGTVRTLDFSTSTSMLWALKTIVQDFHDHPHPDQRPTAKQEMEMMRDLFLDVLAALNNVIINNRNKYNNGSLIDFSLAINDVAHDMEQIIMHLQILYQINHDLDDANKIDMTSAFRLFGMTEAEARPHMLRPGGMNLNELLTLMKDPSAKVKKLRDNVRFIASVSNDPTKGLEKQHQDIRQNMTYTLRNNPHKPTGNVGPV